MFKTPRSAFLFHKDPYAFEQSAKTTVLFGR
jgi:hypothetical protein